MNPWISAAAMVAAALAVVAIRAPHAARSSSAKIARSYKGWLEIVLITLGWLGFLAPIVWAASPLFAFADYPLRPVPFVAGIVCLIVALWWFHRSHVDLGTNWSVTLDVRENHRLITHGVYRSVRHPMYGAILLYALGQTLVVPNWVAGPSYLVTMVILLAFRLGAEERMMLETFGDEYAAYMKRTKRLVPGVW